MSPRYVQRDITINQAVCYLATDMIPIYTVSKEGLLTLLSTHPKRYWLHLQASLTQKLILSLIRNAKKAKHPGKGPKQYATDIFYV